MCLSGVEAEIVCTVGCQDVLGGFHLWAVGSGRRGRRIPVGLQWPKAGGRAFERVDAHLVGTLLGKAANTSAPGDDRISADIVKVFWHWDKQRITQLVRACIRLGHHPKLWKTAKGVVIPKLGKPDYSRVHAYRVISPLDIVSKLVERTAAYLIADHLERKRGLHDGQFGCRKRRSCVDAVAVLMNRTQRPWNEKKVAGALFMDVKSAFNNVSKALLGRRMETLGIEPDLVQWTGSFMSDRQVKLVLDGKTCEASEPLPWSRVRSGAQAAASGRFQYRTEPLRLFAVNPLTVGDFGRMIMWGDILYSR